MLQITKFTPENATPYEHINFSKVSCFDRPTRILSAVGIGENGKIQTVARLTIGYPKQHRTGMECCYGLLEVFHNHEVFYAVDQAGGCGYSKPTAIANSLLKQLFAIDNPSGRWFENNSILWSIADYFGLKDINIIG